MASAQRENNACVDILEGFNIEGCAEYSDAKSHGLFKLAVLDLITSAADGKAAIAVEQTEVKWRWMPKREAMHWCATNRQRTLNH